MTGARLFGVRSLAALIGCLLAVAACAALNSFAQKRLPSAAEYIFSDERIGFDDVETAGRSSRGLVLNALSLQPGATARQGARHCEVTVAYTDEAFARIHALGLIHGSFWGSQPGNAAVISHRMAVALFMSADVVGAMFELDGQRMQVAGVYEADETVLSRLCGDGAEVIFAPHQAYAGDMPARVQFLYIGPGEDQRIGAGDIQALGAGWGAALDAAICHDYQAATRVLAQMQRILRLALGLVAMAALAVLFFRSAAASGARLANLPANRAWGILRCIAAPAACLAGCAAIWALCSFTPYIPPGLLPPNGEIFAWSHYMELFIGAVQRMHMPLPNAYYYNIYFLCAGGMAACISPALAAWVGFVICLWRSCRALLANKKAAAG